MADKPIEFTADRLPRSDTTVCMPRHTPAARPVTVCAAPTAAGAITISRGVQRHTMAVPRARGILMRWRTIL